MCLYVHAMLQTVCGGSWAVNPSTGRAESTFNPQVLSSDPDGSFYLEFY